jgi:hypothetical protein
VDGLEVPVVKGEDSVGEEVMNGSKEVEFSVDERDVSVGEKVEFNVDKESDKESDSDDGEVGRAVVGGVGEEEEDGVVEGVEGFVDIGVVEGVEGLGVVDGVDNGGEDLDGEGLTVSLPDIGRAASKGTPLTERFFSNAVTYINM